jgi:iron-only hydrogenase group A
VAAFHEEENVFDVWEVLQDKDKFVVVQFAPSVRASLGELFDMPPGSLVMGKLYAALRWLGFAHVGDTNFAADLTIMEEGHELIKRITEGGVLPQFTSCCPAWVRYCETFYPELIPHISSAKSPQQMFGSIAKTYLAEKKGIDPRKMIVVSIMPCTAKKFERTREEMCDAWKYWVEKGEVGKEEKFPDVDYVLTTRECARLLKMGGIDLKEMPEEKPDPLVGEYTGAATIFGRTGGVMEAALRTAYEVVTGKPLSQLEFEILGRLNNIKKAEIALNGKKIKVAVAHSLKATKEVCESVKAGGEFAEYTFIEFMACPGGCIGGGGQPILTSLKTIQARTEGLNIDDRQHALRKSHENPEIKQLYQDFLKEPLSPLSHHLLHTTYQART